MTEAAPAVPEDDQLLHQALTEGGLSVETRDPDGAIQFRTVIQLDGDVIHWIRRTPAPAVIDTARAEDHFAAVAVRVAALEGALERLEERARRWMSRARIAARGFTLASAVTAAIGKLGAQPLLLITGGAVGAVSLAAARWIGPRVGRHLLRRIVPWLGTKLR